MTTKTLRPCPNCDTPTYSYNRSRANETPGWCLKCADEYRDANPHGFECVKCEGRHPLYRMSKAAGFENWCVVCVERQPKAVRRKVQMKPPALPPHKLVEYRAMFGMTQAAFAKAVGVSVPAVSSWENGKTSVPPVVQLAMSAFMAGLPPYNG